jgi:hypothetical protein
MQKIILPTIKWDSVNDDLDVREFDTWSRDYELRHLPPDTIFPAAGETWETTCDCVVIFAGLIKWPGKTKLPKVRLPSGDLARFGLDKPFAVFPFGKARLRKGERMRICDDVDMPGSGSPKPMMVSLRPIRYEELEASIIPKELRELPGYFGYVLSVSTARPKLCFDTELASLNEDFRRATPPL